MKKNSRIRYKELRRLIKLKLNFSEMNSWFDLPCDSLKRRQKADQGPLHQATVGTVGVLQAKND